MFVQTALVRRIDAELLLVPEDPRCVLLGHCRVILADQDAQVWRCIAVQLEANRANPAILIFDLRSDWETVKHLNDRPRLV